jgi:hypothetical protein
VVNSLQYVDKGIVPRVDVVLDARARKVTISDNGSGMSVDGLQHFFTMHAENQQRRKGVPGRGKFGTGKSAAFGIGKRLDVTTTRNGKRQTVMVDRATIDASDGDAVPVKFLEKNATAKGEPNGTRVVISDISTKLARQPVIALIERHLSAFRGSPVVTVNGHVCEVSRPFATITRTFAPPPAIASATGSIELTISASTIPLEATHRGVQVTVGNDNLVAIETAGIDSKEYGNHLFGQVDCAALDDPKYDPVSAYNSNRDLTLNKSHPVALALTTFIGASLEQVRSELVAEGRKHKAEADARRLKETTNKIEAILNSDLKEFRERLEGMGNIRRRTSIDGTSGGEDEDPISKIVDALGGEVGRPDGVAGESVTEPIPTEGSTGEGECGTPGGENASAAAVADPSGDASVTAAGKGRRRPRGGLSVDFDHYGAEYDRYHWDAENRLIVINLDHPVVKAAKSLSDEGVTFRRLCYEIAFTAYAVALADLQLERDAAMLASDATYEVRQALKRVWSGAQSLYVA